MLLQNMKVIILHRCNETLEIQCFEVTLDWVKSGSGAPGPESASRGTKSTTFAQGMFQPFNLQKFDTDFEMFGSSIGVCIYATHSHQN